MALKRKPVVRRIRVLIANATHMGGELLAFALARSPDIEVLACADSPDRVIESVTELKPDVAVISARFEQETTAGIDLLALLRDLSPKLRVIVLLDESDPDLVVQAFRAGAQGIFCRTDSHRMLSKAIQCVHEGQVWANTAQLRMAFAALSQAAPVRPVNANGERLLSRREEEVVSLVSLGMTNREIAARLNLSHHTIKNYLLHIFEKLGLSKRVELVLYCSAGTLVHTEASKTTRRAEEARSPVILLPTLDRWNGEPNRKPAESENLEPAQTIAAYRKVLRGDAN